MGRIVVSEFVTLDGVFEDPGGAEQLPNGGWAFRFDRGEAGNKFKVDELMAADAMLLGRVTYEGFAAAWPNRSGDEFSDKMNGMPKYVDLEHAAGRELGELPDPPRRRRRRGGPAARRGGGDPGRRQRVARRTR